MRDIIFRKINVHYKRLFILIFKIVALIITNVCSCSIMNTYLTLCGVVADIIILLATYPELVFFLYYNFIYCLLILL